MEIDNGDWGKNRIYVKYEQEGEIHVTAGDGHRYRAELGFLSSPEALAKVQEFWGYGGRGGGNWKMIVMVRKQIDWISCAAEDQVCYEVRVDAGEPRLTGEVYYRDNVWVSLANDYLAGGWRAVAGNAYYHAIQASVFEPICKAVPDIPVIGVKFTRVD